MSLLDLVVRNLVTPPMVSFVLGFIGGVSSPRIAFPKWVGKILTMYILLSIGIKGGAPLIDHLSDNLAIFVGIVGGLVAWGFVHPFLTFYWLKRFTKLDKETLGAIAASFGSISVMTFIAATTFLEQLGIRYEGLLIVALAVMEIPAIISGIFLAKGKGSMGKALHEAFFNKAVFTIVLGLALGVIFDATHLTYINEALLFLFKPALCLFLLDMGMRIGHYKKHFHSFSLSLALFGFYMPLLAGGAGLLLSYLLHLDVGTGTLITVLTASASYIAVPAAMRIALPAAKEAIYLPLALGITFPFNTLLGIPLYYQAATLIL